MSSSLPRLTLCFSVTLLCAACASSPGRRPPAEKADVTAEDLEKHANEPIETVLQRKASGVQVMRTPDGGIALQIRGVSAYDASNRPPLYVVNDHPVEPGPGGTLTGINPYDIESIKVLKGADAAIYGIRGADGVILITLKKAPRPNR